jgi:circadian clock protein KaiC
VSGTAGTGKTSLSAHLAEETCKRGERVLYLAFEESPAQLMRNMKSIGIDLEPHLKKGLLKLHASRPTLHGLEMHLVQMHKMVEEFDPSLVIVDPISNFVAAGNAHDALSMLLRLTDYLKSRQITAMFTHLSSGGVAGAALENTDLGVSSLIDTWILLRDIELGGERNKGLYILKSRGMKHSNQIREYLLTAEGVQLEDVYVGPEGVLTGSMRAAQEARENAAQTERAEEIARRQRELERKRAALEAQIAGMRAEFSAVEEESSVLAKQDRTRQSAILESREATAARRGADNNSATARKRK